MSLQELRGTKGTLAKTITSNLSLVERLKQKQSNPVLILDLSSSMNEDCEPGRTKLDALISILRGLRPSTKIGFNDNAWVCTPDEVLKARFGTNMARAIFLAKQRGYKAAVMITDGEANDKSQTLEAIKDFNLRILYVGPGPKPAFLDDLASAGGSTCTLEDLTNPKELEGKLQLLLTEGQTNKVIEL